MLLETSIPNRKLQSINRRPDVTNASRLMNACSIAKIRNNAMPNSRQIFPAGLSWLTFSALIHRSKSIKNLISLILFTVG
jgi:hypothetical protein